MMRLVIILIVLLLISFIAY
ncbi:TPA: type I toxin-antitoxin system toxin IbsC [Escherichia coli]|nr:type I toxin-antitoxin system toxin IbsC [Escherichia coli]